VTDSPETRFAKLGEDLIAYQVFGSGPVDLVYVTASGDAMNLRWDYPPYASFLKRVGSFARVIMFDRCGCGASDSVSTDVLPSWERWADEAQAVMDAAGSERASMLGMTDAGQTVILFAALLPERTHSLILGNATARFAADEDYPGMPSDALPAVNAIARGGVWTEEFQRIANPDSSNDPAYWQWALKTNLLGTRPREARAHFRWMARADIRDMLGAITRPTLVIHRERSPVIPVAHGRYIAEHIPGARFVGAPGCNSNIWSSPNEEVISAIGEFITGARPAADVDRALAAVLFTDIVGSTELAASLGDRRWRALLDSHDAIANTVVDQHRGRIVKLTGDGALAVFDGPGRAIRCAAAIQDALKALGIGIRAGLHTGEVELRGDDIGGIGVNIAARILDHANAGELLASQAVPMLMTGSGIQFIDRGDHELKGVPGSWRLFAVKG
jgi:class 3 adenylate cyclase/pimeloyl-ACP methyl ester carboxylesterase